MIIKYIGEQGRRPRQAEGQEDRLHLSRRRLRPRADPAARAARRRIYGFEVKLYPVAAQDMQNQSSQWLNVRRDRPDYMVMWGWGAMNPPPSRRPSRRLSRWISSIGLVAGRGRRARAAAPAPKASRCSTGTRWARNFPAIQDIQKHVVDKGLSKAPKDKVGEILYNRGVYNSMLIAEASARPRSSPARRW